MSPQNVRTNSTEASVTDLNGETQTDATYLKISSVSHYIEAEDIKNVFSGEEVKVKVETKNYNDQNLQKSYRVKLSKFETPDRVFRNNFKLSMDITQGIIKGNN